MKKKSIFAAGIISGVLLGLTACSATAESGQTEQPSIQESIESKETTESGQTEQSSIQESKESTESGQTEQPSIQDSKESIESQTATAIETAKEGDSGRCDKAFGSYLVPQGWVEAETFSTEDKFFYVREGEEEAEAPDNISINVGKNRYAAQDHLAFRKAIMAQLLRQTGGAEGVSVTGAGSQTDNGDILYQFTIAEEESGIVTTQYYIVGEYQFCLIHETNFTQSEEVDEVAKEIVNSFVWGDN